MLSHRGASRHECTGSKRAAARRPPVDRASTSRAVLDLYAIPVVAGLLTLSGVVISPEFGR